MIDTSAVSNPNVRLVVEAMDGILVEHSEAQVDRHFHPDFVQHNPWAKDGAAHVKEMCAFEFGVQMHRYVAQGDLVAYHGIYTAPNPLGELPLLCVDVWRVSGGQIVEHWDALQPIAAATVEAFVAGPGDGGADVAAGQVTANAALVRRLVEGTAGVDAFAGRFEHHAPESGNASEFVRWRDERSIGVRQTVASGDLVMMQLDVRGDTRQVVYAWFRVANGAVTDLWTVAQDFVADDEAATTHPHF